MSARALFQQPLCLAHALRLAMSASEPVVVTLCRLSVPLEAVGWHILCHLVQPLHRLPMGLLVVVVVVVVLESAALPVPVSP